jgi:DNA-binding CsgD family transcriptional regulator
VNRLVGRDSELAALSALIEDLPKQGGAHVVLGEPGIGKTSLLRQVAETALEQGTLVLEIAGIEPEAGMPFAGLQHLLRPLIEYTDRLPTSQRRALLTAFEMEDGPPPQPFLVSVACLGVLTEAAEEQPVLVAVDDAQWLDLPTHETLAFVARRLERESVLLVATVRSGHDGPLMQAGLDTTVLEGLDDQDSREMLSRHARDIDPAGQARILAESQGNPLALVELPVAWRTQGGHNPVAVPLTARLERAFAARIHDLPDDTRAVVLAAAVNDEDNLAEIIVAARPLSTHAVTVDSLEPAARAGLLTYDSSTVRFRHPLVRSGVLAGEPMSRRHEAHAATAAALELQPYRRTWHLAHAIVGIDDEVADALEDNHVVALRRGSVTSAIWALERSAQLTSDPARRGRRLLLAAEHAFGLGRADIVDRLVRAAAREGLTELDLARLEWLREIFNDGVPGDAARVGELSEIATRSAQSGDLALAMNLLLGAALRCWWAEAGAVARAKVVSAADEVAEAQPGNFRLDPRYIATIAVAQPVVSAPTVCHLLGQIVLESVPDAEALRLLAMAAHAVGETVPMIDFSNRAEARLREQGRLGLLSHVLTMQILDRIEVGDWEKATACVEEGKRVAHDSGQPIWNDGTLTLSAILSGIRGNYDEAMSLAARTEQLANGRKLNDLLACVQLARGYACVSNGRYAEGFAELRRLFDSSDSCFHLTERYHGIAQFAEAATRCGEQETARRVLDSLERETTGNPAQVLKVHLAYARAVLADDEDAEQRFRDALDQDLVRWPWPKARLELAYGTWLRRQRRVAESRQPLRSAQTIFELIGATSWAEQASAELRAAGERIRQSGPAARDALSAQELQIARLAAEGFSNREIGERLFLSPRTVGSHLYRIFPKLGISSRAQLATSLELN